MKTSELTGAALNWAVAKCEGGHIGVDNKGVFFDAHDGDGFTSFEPSTVWAQGGPIIEREKLCPCPSSTAVGSAWFATDLTGHTTHFGPTPLIAAMRCYVGTKLGHEVEIPEELQ